MPHHSFPFLGVFCALFLQNAHYNRLSRIIFAFTVCSLQCVAINLYTKGQTLSDSFAAVIDDYVIFPSSCHEHSSGIQSLPTNEDYLLSYRPTKPEEGGLKMMETLIKEPVTRDQLNEILETGNLTMKRPFIPPVKLSGDGRDYNDEVKGTTEILNGANPETETSSNDSEDVELRDKLTHNLSEVTSLNTKLGVSQL